MDPEGLREEIRQITKLEVEAFGRLLRDEIERTPMRADGTMNQADLRACVLNATRRYAAGEED